MYIKKKLRDAIKTGNAEQVSEILRAAPKEPVRLTKGWSPLHVAVRRGDLAVITAIIKAGADVNAMTDAYQTPLDVALRDGETRVSALLRKNGARIAAELSLHGAASAGNLKCARQLLNAGADIDAVLEGKTPVCIALENRHWNVAMLLLRKDCAVDSPQHADTTPLHVAAASGAPEKVLAAIVKRGAQLDSRDSLNWTPLFWAAGKGHREVVDWLLARGATVSVGDAEGQSPVYRALQGHHVELASHLIDRGAKASLHQAVQCDHLGRARQLLAAGAAANEVGTWGTSETPLVIAVWNDSTDMVALLLEFGADPNQQDARFHSGDRMYGGNTSLHHAVRSGSAKMVKLLLAHGADPDITNADGTTPLELARLKDRMHLAGLMEKHLDKKLSLEATQNGIEKLYPVRKVAELLSVDDSFVMDLIKMRKITALKLDENTIRIPAGSVQRYLAKLQT